MHNTIQELCYTLFSLELLKGIFTVVYSPLGTNTKSAEEQAWVHFGDFLDECEGSEHTLLWAALFFSFFVRE